MEDDKEELIIYETPNGKLDIQLDLENETIWLTQRLIAQLFECSTDNVGVHLKNIYESGELEENRTTEFFSVVQKEGNRNVNREIKHYNLDAIISVGYRVNSTKATKFRQWATQTLKEYIIKGFVLNTERLKNPGGWDYFDELLEKIREIRASEKRFYQKVRDLFALSVDYKDDIKASNDFFAEVQNKLLHAVTNNTAAEIIVNRADATKPNMNLTNWSGSRVRKQDVIIAKNYLQQNEIKELDRLVSMFLDYAENQAQRRRQLSMSDWKEKVDGFLNFNDYEILKGKGAISRKQANEIAKKRYLEFDEARKKQEALEADAEDLKELETIEHEMIAEKKLGRNK
ncbi:MAG: hydroxyacid dehydrogenase [Candidatus Melainabacteria bacterium]|nr:MAG: hydroxyacid dehydrogenase [Candidatus Melainabacteria bacterium]